MTITATPHIAMVGRRFTVAGMTCSHCENAIVAEVAALPGVTKVVANATTGTVTVESTVELDPVAVAAAVDEAGYELVR